jgi:hypothetical protein
MLRALHRLFRRKPRVIDRAHRAHRVDRVDRMANPEPSWEFDSSVRVR